MCAGPIALGNIATVWQLTNLEIQGSSWKRQWRMTGRKAITTFPTSHLHLVDHSIHLPNWDILGIRGNGVLGIINKISLIKNRYTLVVLGRVDVYSLYPHQHFLPTETTSLVFHLCPSAHLPFPPYGSSLALKHYLGFSSRECSIFLILGAPAHTECPHPPRLHTWWVKAEPWWLQIQAIHPQLSRCQKMYPWLLCSIQYERPRWLYFTTLQNSCQELNQAP